jgi:hypothetical protein
MIETGSDEMVVFEKLHHHRVSDGVKVAKKEAEKARRRARRLARLIDEQS